MEKPERKSRVIEYEQDNSKDELDRAEVFSAAEEADIKHDRSQQLAASNYSHLVNAQM